MNVFWLLNIVIPEAGKALNLNSSVMGGWLTGSLNGIRGKLDSLTVATLDDGVSKTRECTSNGVTFVAFPRLQGSKLELLFAKYLNSHSFDVIHIFGTEGAHSAVMMKVAPPEKVVINIQGLTHCCATHYLEGIPPKYIYDNMIKKVMRKVARVGELPAIYGKRQFEKSGANEYNTICNCMNMIGRTNWDRAYVTQINPKLHYYHVDETLRDSFYTDKTWTPQTCERHSIFLSQAGYPIKGFHYFAQALAIVKKFYPDTKVYVSGSEGIKDYQGLRLWRIRHFGGYFGYVNSMIHDYGLYDSFHVLGFLDERQMCEQYLKANVFVSPSVIENSPNSVGEAMMLGTPVVASYVGGIPDMLDNGVEGLLYQTSAPYMLADCVMRIFADDDLALELSRNAIKRAHVTHDKKKNADALMSVYGDIVNKN